MAQLQVTSVSSKGQVVIPNEIRAILGISSGTKMIVFTDGSNVLLKPIQEPRFEVFKKLVKESDTIIKNSGLKKNAMRKIIKQARNENRS